MNIDLVQTTQPKGSTEISGQLPGKEFSLEKFQGGAMQKVSDDAKMSDQVIMQLISSLEEAGFELEDISGSINILTQESGLPFYKKMAQLGFDMDQADTAKDILSKFIANNGLKEKEVQKDNSDLKLILDKNIKLKQLTSKFYTVANNSAELNAAQKAFLLNGQGKVQNKLNNNTELSTEEVLEGQNKIDASADKVNALLQKGKSKFGGQSYRSRGDGASSTFESVLDNNATNTNESIIADKVQGLFARKTFMEKMSETQLQEVKSLNNDEIIKHTQFLATKGGGEAKVQLFPKGMGQLNLKVNVEHGAVNVEIIASNTHAKALIDGAMDDLKTSMLKQHLSLDGIKVTVADDAQMSSQKEFDQATNFLNDFSDNNREQKEAHAHEMNYMNQGSSSIFDSNTLGERSSAVNPITRAHNGRLNLVA